MKYKLEYARNWIEDPQVKANLDELPAIIKTSYTHTIQGDPRAYPRPDTSRVMPVTDEDVEWVQKYLQQMMPRYNATISLLKCCQGQIGLDVGICYGLVDIVLREKYGVKVEGAEMPRNIPAYCSMMLNRNIPVTPWDITQEIPPFEPNAFDFLIFTEVLEHVKTDPFRLVSTLATLLKKKGIILISTPNIARLSNIEKLLRGENVIETWPRHLPIGVDITDYVHHVREYTPGEVVELIESAGLEVRDLWMCPQWTHFDLSLHHPLLNDIILIVAVKPE